MRKILSIVLALGMILALSAIATPVAAKVSGVMVVVDPDFDCAGQIGVYNISFNISTSLTEGTHSVCIKFPEGTVVPPTGAFPAGAWKNGDILIGDASHPDGVAVFGAEVTVTGTQVCFLVPDDFGTATGGGLWVYFTDDACIINPPAKSTYQLEVWTSRAPDSIPVKNSIPYKIYPCLSGYIFDLDFGPTYPGIADGFIPPFKACGQNMTTTVYDPDLGTDGGFWEPFYLAFADYPEGCFAPCETVDIYLQLTASPQVPCGLTPSHVSLNLTVLVGDPEANNISEVLTWVPCFDPDGIPDRVLLADDYPLDANELIYWLGYIHFDVPGDYTICFTAECNGGPICTPPDCTGEGNILVQDCIDFTVHQWKDAAKVTLDEKWNLISLPLVPFDTDIDVMLASLDTFDYDTYYGSNKMIVQDNLLSIWNYDAATKTWKTHGNGQSSLTTIEDGKAYWFRLTYPIFAGVEVPGFPPNDCGNYTWWVFGTELPEPPASPKVYPVVAGWNMVGFTSMTAEDTDAYLANWISPYAVPVIYGWDHGCFAVQKWNDLPFGGAEQLIPGQGYWMAFPTAGSVFQIVP